MQVCELPDKRVLFCSVFGTPFIKREDGSYTGMPLTGIRKTDKEAIEKWQLDNDCLRARGDIRYQAASRACQLNIY